MTPEPTLRDKLAEQLGSADKVSDMAYSLLLDAIRAAVAAEREACAKLVESAPLPRIPTGSLAYSLFVEIAAAIRARSNP